jgi:predicted nucleotidyltransferase
LRSGRNRKSRSGPHGISISTRTASFLEITALWNAKKDICRYRIVEMSVFGSAARGEMRPDSDIDIMVVLDPEARLGWEFFGIADELSAVLGHSVDLESKTA